MSTASMVRLIKHATKKPSQLFVHIAEENRMEMHNEQVSGERTPAA